MKGLLIRPISRKMPIIIPNLGLGYLATALRKDKHEIKILDCVKEKYNYDDFKKNLKKFKYDFIGIQLFTCDYNSVKKMLKIIKNYNPNILTLIGGPHVSGAPISTLKDMEDADFGFIGEAENSIRELLKEKINPNKISGLVYREKGKVKINSVTKTEDIDELGIPAWDLMDPRTYPIAPHGSFAKQAPVAPIITTRGCPYQCTYCAVVVNTSRKFRKRKVGDIIKEIEILHKKYGVKEIHIEDDNFTLDKKYVIEFCNKLIEKDLKISWACPNGVRLDTLDKGMLQLMEKVGCYSFAVGIESGSPKILKDMKRVVTIKKIIEKVKLIRDNTKIRMTGFCIMGYPGETKKDMQMTSDLAYKLPLHRVQFSNFLPLPGTEIYNRLITSGEIKEEELNWDDYLDNHITYSPKGISHKELRKIMKKAFFRFYFRPQIVLGLLKEIQSPQHAWIITKRILDTFV